MTHVIQRAVLTFRGTRQAHIPSMEQDALSHAGPLVPGKGLLQILLDTLGIVGSRQIQSIGYAFHMSIDDDGRLTEGRAQHDIGCLASDSRQ